MAVMKGWIVAVVAVGSQRAVPHHNADPTWALAMAACQLQAGYRHWGAPAMPLQRAVEVAAAAAVSAAAAMSAAVLVVLVVVVPVAVAVAHLQQADWYLALAPPHMVRHVVVKASESNHHRAELADPQPHLGNTCEDPHLWVPPWPRCRQPRFRQAANTARTCPPLGSCRIPCVERRQTHRAKCA